jgi:hypothetical protein
MRYGTPAIPITEGENDEGREVEECEYGSSNSFVIPNAIKYS